MSIWNKIVVGLICVASLALFYMAARTIKTHQYWRELAAKHQQKIDLLQKQNHELSEGDQQQGKQAEPGIRQLRVELNKLLLDRRRAWFQCEPKVKVDREKGTATVTVATDQPDPHGIAPDTILYAFEEADSQKGGRYLGEFKAAKADEKQKTVVLVPATRLTDAELERLGAAKRPWELYEVMPSDNHEVLASLDDEEKTAMLRQVDSLPEYLKDGKPAAKGDPAERVSDGKYVRQLRDYQVLLGAQRIRHTLLTDRLDAATRDKKLVDDALVQAKEQEQAYKKYAAAAKEEVAKFAVERDAVAVYRKALERATADAQKAVDKLIETNRAMAGRIAKLQFEAARRIDQRTRAMARSGAGGQ